MKQSFKKKYIFNNIFLKIFILFFCIYLFSLKTSNNILRKKKRKNLNCLIELDPIYSFNMRLKSEPFILCKSDNSLHICYKNNMTYYWEKNGILCLMNNFIINPSYWKEDGFTFKGPINRRTRGSPLISKGFFNMECNQQNKIKKYNKIYKTYLDSWNYDLKNINQNISDFFPDKTIFIISRNQDSPNLFHGGSEFINAFSIMKLLNINPKNIQILFLESMKFNEDPYYDLYKNVISGGNEPIHIRDIKNNIQIKNAVHIPINWDSPCFTKCRIPKCKYPSLTYIKLYKNVLRYMNIRKFVDSLTYNKEIFYYPKSVHNPNSNKYKKIITFEWRRPWPKERKHQHRLLGNGPELVDKLSNKLPKNILIRLVDTARLSYYQQISIMQNTDYLLGIHGAGLFLSIFLPAHAIVHEIKHENKMNNLQILSILSGHKCYSDQIKSYVKSIDLNKYIFFNPNDLAKKIKLHLKNIK